MTVQPDKHGIFPAATWRESNPHYDAPTPVRHTADGRTALVDGGIIWDADQLKYEKAADLAGRGKGRARK